MPSAIGNTATAAITANTATTATTNYYIEQAISAARRSSQRKYRTGAVIVKHKERWAVNGWSHVPNYTLKHTPRSMHAELHAILRAARIGLTTQDTSIYIATLTDSGLLATTSAPCGACEVALRKAGIRQVYYTTKTGVKAVIYD